MNHLFSPNYLAFFWLLPRGLISCLQPVPWLYVRRLLSAYLHPVFFFPEVRCYFRKKHDSCKGHWVFIRTGNILNFYCLKLIIWVFLDESLGKIIDPCKSLPLVLRGIHLPVLKTCYLQTAQKFSYSLLFDCLLHNLLVLIFTSDY